MFTKLNTVDCIITFYSSKSYLKSWGVRSNILGARTPPKCLFISCALMFDRVGSYKRSLYRSPGVFRTFQVKERPEL